MEAQLWSAYRIFLNIGIKEKKYIRIWLWALGGVWQPSKWNYLQIHPNVTSINSVDVVRILGGVRKRALYPPLGNGDLPSLEDTLRFSKCIPGG